MFDDQRNDAASLGSRAKLSKPTRPREIYDVLERLLDGVATSLAPGARDPERLEGPLSEAAARIAAVARENHLRCEQLIVAVKEDWNCVVSARRWTAETSLQEVRARIIGLCIRSFYTAPIVETARASRLQLVRSFDPETPPVREIPDARQRSDDFQQNRERFRMARQSMSRRLVAQRADALVISTAAAEALLRARSSLIELRLEREEYAARQTASAGTSAKDF